MKDVIFIPAARATGELFGNYFYSSTEDCEKAITKALQLGFNGLMAWGFSEAPKEPLTSDSIWEGPRGPQAAKRCDSVHSNDRCQFFLGHDGVHQHGKEVWDHK